MGSVPSTRWALEEIADTSVLTSVQAACVRHGGFVAGAQRFDASPFGLSPAEAGAMDPQQRLLLELGYAALHGSSQRRVTLMGGDGGVFLGIERPTGLAQPLSARGSVYAVTATMCRWRRGGCRLRLGCRASQAGTALVGARGGALGRVCDPGGESRAVLALAVSLKLTLHGTLGGVGWHAVGGRSARRSTAPTGTRARGRRRARAARGQRRDTATLQCSASGRPVGEPDSAQRPGAAHAGAALKRGARSLEVGLRRTARDGAGRSDGGRRAGGGAGAAENPRSIVIGAAEASVGHTEASPVRWAAVLSEMAGVVTGNAQLRSLNPPVASVWVRAGCFVLSLQAVSSQLACGVSSLVLWHDCARGARLRRW